MFVDNFYKCFISQSKHMTNEYNVSYKLFLQQFKNHESTQ